MNLDEIHRLERAKWDALTPEQLPQSAILPPGANFYDEVRGSPLLPGVAEFLGDLRGKHVLEYGCGLGHMTVLLARSGASVSAFDLSPVSVGVAHKRAVLNGVEATVELTVAPGESLPYPDETFDVVFGKAILHHLNVNLGSAELYRVLKPDGKAAFTEPMGMNPLLNFVRGRVPYPHKQPREADRPLNYDEIRAWGRRFREFHYREIQLLSMLERGFGLNKRLTPLRRADDLLLQHLPFLRPYCRYVVMFMTK